MTSKKRSVIVDLPAYSPVDEALTYQGDALVGQLVRVPLGKKEVLGVVWGDGLEDEETTFEVKVLSEVFDVLPALNPHWRALVQFTAGYYQRSLGEVALQALPPALKKLNLEQLNRRLAKVEKTLAKTESSDAQHEAEVTRPELTPEQQAVLEVLQATLMAQGTEGEQSQAPAAYLLQGATGSGKTEVYLRATEKALALGGQVLVLVPEINLTPQLQARFQERFPSVCIASMHSGLTSAQRLQAWLQAHLGHARIVLGTRMAVFASLPHLKLIVVDEEHDPSYKQYEGARWSARDLAVWRGYQEKIPVVLGSATPSLESWLHAKNKRYQLLSMPSRIGLGAMPKVRLVDANHMPRQQLLVPALVDAIQKRVDQGEQSLILLNRRGYAPVLYCHSCGWKSECPHCTALRVFHRADRSIRCHHCGFSEPVPRFCPTCGDLDLQPVGKGTERLEEMLQEGFKRPDGSMARVIRIDADSTRHAGSLVKHLDEVHEGDVDILVGTQMIAKGHDFRRVTLVAAVNPDTALFSSDFRSGERLMSLLMQAAGRAGRDQTLAEKSELWVQTTEVEHPMFQALKRYDFSSFADSTLAEREMAMMPPYSHLALIRVDGRTQEAVQKHLQTLYEQGQVLLNKLGLMERVMLYPPIPAAMRRIANVERGQMMLESSSRGALQQFMAQWRVQIQTVRGSGIIRWAIDVDPQQV